MKSMRGPEFAMEEVENSSSAHEGRFLGRIQALMSKKDKINRTQERKMACERKVPTAQRKEASVSLCPSLLDFKDSFH